MRSISLILEKRLRTLVMNPTAKQVIEEELRRNPIKNRAISGFSGQKSGTRIILIIIYTLSDLGVLSNPIGSLSLAN